MSSVYVINFTDPSVTPFVLNPAQIDGPGGASAHTSLSLHGTGRLSYGEAVNENFVKMLEHFASPAQATIPVIGIDTINNSGAVGTHEFLISGDYTNEFISGVDFTVSSSTGGVNDGTYTVNAASYDPSTNRTTLVVNQSIADSSATVLGIISYSITQPDPVNVPKPWLLGQIWLNKTDNQLYVYKLAQGTSAKRWAAVGSGGVYIGPTPPIASGLGDFWFDETDHQLKINHHNTWESVADNYVKKSGDTITSDGTPGSVGATSGVLKINDGTIDFLFIGEGHGVASIAPDIRANGHLVMAGDQDVQLLIDGTNDGAGEFVVKKGGFDSTATTIFHIENSGVLKSEISNYKSLVVDPNHIPNKDYVDTAIANTIDLAKRYFYGFGSF
jgi:hypothetical protein